MRILDYFDDIAVGDNALEDTGLEYLMVDEEDDVDEREVVAGDAD